MNERRLVPRRFETGSNDDPGNRVCLEPVAGRTSDQLTGNEIIPVREWAHIYDLIRGTGWKEAASVHRPGVSGKPNTCHSHVDN